MGTTLMTGPTPTQGHLPPPSRKCLFSSGVFNCKSSKPASKGREGHPWVLGLQNPGQSSL